MHPQRAAPRQIEVVKYDESRSVSGLLREIGRTLFSYLGGQLAVCLILSGLYMVGYALLGVPLWPLIAVVCGFLNLVPHFGSVIAALLSVGVSLMGGLGWERTLGVLGVYVAVSTFESYWLTPRIIGRRLKIRPLYVFLAVLLGGAMFGFVGLVLAVPVLAVLMVIYRFTRPAARKPREGV
jgi:predicted PurR-regulated permease PerM